MTIVIALEAQEDLKEAYQHIKRDNPKAADDFLRIIDSIGMLASGVVDGRKVVLKDGRTVKGWPAPPYRIYIPTKRASIASRSGVSPSSATD